MACSVCGKWSPFQTVCAECRARQQANGLTQSSRWSSLFSRTTSVSTRIIINGRQVAAGNSDAASLLSPELLKTMASQAGMSVERLQQLLGQANVEAAQAQAQMTGTPDLTMQQATVPAVTPHVMVECPKCHHRVKQAAQCMYCGVELPVQQHTSQGEEAKVDDVDRKFLQNDVRPDAVKEEEEQPLHDTFSDRLREL